MIVSFRTAGGSVFHLDHANNEFVQEAPVLRRGPLFNKPQVVKGKRVQIWTADATTPIRVIQTAPVIEREVTIEKQSIQTPLPSGQDAVCASQAVPGNEGAAEGAASP